MEQIVYFRNFANSPKMVVCIFYLILKFKLLNEFNFWGLISTLLTYNASRVICVYAVSSSLSHIYASHIPVVFR